MASFPLPHRPQLDLSIERQDARLRTEVDAGPPIMRRRFSAARTVWTFTLPPMTGAEKATLDAFYVTTTKEGSLSFTWRDETGATRSFRFLAVPKWRQVAAHHVPALQRWQPSLALEVLP